MTTAELLETIRHLPADAKLTLTVEKGDLVRALEDRDDRPERIVTTAWCAEELGMSREWWADACRAGDIPEAFQSEEGAPWRLTVIAARRHLQQHRNANTHSRSRRRVPWKRRGDS